MRRSDTREVARFFGERFLQAKLAFDAQQNTDRLYKTLLRAQNELRRSLSAEQAELLGRSIAGVMQTRTVSLPTGARASSS